MRDSRTRQTTGPGPDPRAQDAAMLHRLGLEPGSSLDDVPIAHDELVAFLATAPRALRAWAHAQATEADAAYAHLTDTVAPARAHPDALVDGALSTAAQPGEPARQPARQATPPAEPAPVVQSEEDRIEELLASVTPSRHRDAVATSGAPARRAAGTTITLRLPGKRILAAASLVVALGVVAVGVYGMGAQAPAVDATSDGSTADATTQGSGIDEAKVADLMTRIAADPNDADALLGIGDEYFQARDFTSAADWFRKATVADPTDVKALLALGAALFNDVDLDGAEMQWQRAVELDPSSVEGHYDLGFLFLNRQPPDMAGMQREWSEVIRLAPGSEIAGTVQTHLTALASPLPNASGGPAASAAPVASAAPATSAQP